MLEVGRRKRRQARFGKFGSFRRKANLSLGSRSWSRGNGDMRKSHFLSSYHLAIDAESSLIDERPSLSMSVFWIDVWTSRAHPQKTLGLLIAIFAHGTFSSNGTRRDVLPVVTFQSLFLVVMAWSWNFEVFSSFSPVISSQKFASAVFFRQTQCGGYPTVFL